MHYSDGGSGMRVYDAALDVGAEVADGGSRYRSPPFGAAVLQAAA